jgi:thiamine-phosphate pyrophosphorylase
VLEGRRLYLLFTPGLCRADPWHTLEQALAGGVELVQWRDKSGDRASLARTLAICSDAHVPVIVNDFVDLALVMLADGAHVGQGDLPAAEARRLLGKAVLGVSTHDVAQVRAAEAAGADYLGFGPCFPTATKGYEQGLPAGSLREAIAATRLPVFAIGGIRADNVAALAAEGGTRFAVGAAILAAPDPEAAARELVRSIGSASGNE